MDSGNSGSLQSSSGGDDEYDSRSESVSALLSSSSRIGANPQLPPPSSSPHHQRNQNPNHPTSLLDPLSNYFDVFQRSAPPPNAHSPVNIDLVWSRGLGSETDVGALMVSSSSSQPIMGPRPRPHPHPHPQDANARLTTQIPSSKPLTQQVADHSGGVSASSSDQPNIAQRSKKRSRASRRAPTTVLTTDTSNFRAMVQEFTGIPAPPFSASLFPQSRLDLFGSASSIRSIHSEPIRPSPPYLLRPFAQKGQPPLVAPSSSRFASFTNTSTTHNMNTSNSTSTANYQLLSELALSKQSQNLANMQSDPILTFQSLLQSTILPKNSLPDSSTTRMGSSEEFNPNHGQVRNHFSELPNFRTSDGMLLRNENVAPNCGDRVGSNNEDQQHLKSFNENFGNSQRKMDYSGSSSHDKGSENNATTRGGEGMVDSWICSSD